MDVQPLLKHRAETFRNLALLFSAAAFFGDEIAFLRVLFFVTALLLYTYSESIFEDEQRRRRKA